MGIKFLSSNFVNRMKKVFSTWGPLRSIWTYKIHSSISPGRLEHFFLPLVVKKPRSNFGRGVLIAGAGAMAPRPTPRVVDNH